MIAGGGQGLLVRWGCAAAVLTLALDVWLVQAHCALGGALANALGQSAGTIGVWIIAGRRFGFRIPAGFVSRLSVSAGTMAAGVGLLAWLAPAQVALLCGPPLGVVVYLTLLRHGHVLGDEDAGRLVAAQSLLPEPMRWPYRFLLSWAIGEPRTTP